MSSNSRRFPTQVPRGDKRNAGSTPVETTPLNIRIGSGAGVDAALREHIHKRLSRQLGKFAPVIERSTVRIVDINGKRGGIDMACTIKVVLTKRPSVVCESRGATAREAFDLAAATAERTVRRALGRAEMSAKRASRALKVSEPVAATVAAELPNPPPEEGSYIGRRVGRSAQNLARAAARPEKERRDSLVDTAQAGVSASARKAGGGSTARRNTKLNTAGLTSTLEDSAQERPSRKSTRRSADGTKRDANLKLRQTNRVSAPKQRALRSQAKATKRGA